MSTPRKTKAEETPGYCKTEDLANLFALTGQSINQLTRDGVIKRESTPAGKRYNSEIRPGLCAVSAGQSGGPQ